MSDPSNFLWEQSKPVFPESHVIAHLQSHPEEIENFLRETARHSPERFRHHWFAPILARAITTGNEERVRWMLVQGGDDLLYQGQFVDYLIGPRVPQRDMIAMIAPYFSDGQRAHYFQMTTTAGKWFLLSTWPPEVRSPVDVNYLLRRMDKDQERHALWLHLVAHHMHTPPRGKTGPDTPSYRLLEEAAKYPTLCPDDTQ